ncbi:HD domain-containing protein [Vibrio sp. SG41-7]|jgi:response regulator RpfG family c-di-GMP phosphodiesterase|uniref:HD-GYP domain-containing protein n=1 Tax=Vibrio TaxID=662 RepID=UPI001602F8B6|nr:MULTISPECIES: HD domain-containing phosphohydrolase [Vibrio]MBB1466320.1 HD domain-containing protein [Vibrio sp. SG41-7]
MNNIINALYFEIVKISKKHPNISRLSVALVRDGYLHNFFVWDNTKNTPTNFPKKKIGKDSNLGDIIISNDITVSGNHKSKMRLPFYISGNLLGVIYLNSKTEFFFQENFKEINNEVENLKKTLKENLLKYLSFKEKSYGILIESQKKDIETYKHLIRVKSYCYLLASEYEKRYSSEKINPFLISEYSTYHDIGKINIPDDILLFTGKYSSEQRAIMNQHCQFGVQIIKNIIRDNNLNSIDTQVMTNIILHHHERWDGHGYPKKLRGSEIPIEARIVTICDVFDALISKRPYKEPWPKDDAISFIKSQSGKIFDPELVSIFVQKQNDMYSFYQEQMD